MLRKILPKDPQINVMKYKLQRINYNGREAIIAINKVLRFSETVLGVNSKNDLETAKHFLKKILEETK